MRKQKVSFALGTVRKDAVEELAKVLHAEYRASFNSLHTEQSSRAGTRWAYSKNEHNHGWAGCHKKDYFRRRADRIQKAANRTAIASLFLVPERLLGPIK